MSGAPLARRSPTRLPTGSTTAARSAPNARIFS